MAVRLVVANSENSYLATDARILIDAFEVALNELGLVDRNCPAALAVANRSLCQDRRTRSCKTARPYRTSRPEVGAPPANRAARSLRGNGAQAR
jgi:hypothetical protein